MTGRLHAWLRQAHSDLAMAVYASEGGFHAQACDACSQAAEKALKAVLLALDQEPERTHSIERLLSALESLGIETAPLRQLPLKAPIDLFDERDGALALQVARAVVAFADRQLGGLVQPYSS